ncbi:hypothetical protein FRX31_025065 [Thalictrum thalictroides]|uniref:R13L1/DRL21-like LRR repeat region domain-containing protein n=1 Tax=Thalictrum thalictroides TaxID=46969 RepID=A0A7J6VJS5_THATH|nr:hypothetical protein FRX31_025065 [Thalictrum thalictroides]
MPPGFGRLIDLQTLGTFVAGVDTRCEIGELMDMRSLHGTLCITQLENVADRRKATQAALNDKQHLRKLKFIWGEVEVLKQKDLPISVRSLIVNSCSLLKRWYETEGKNDLSRIASNREVTIDGLRISSS